MIVVDVHIIASLLLKNDFTPLAKKLLLKDNEWIAPLLWRSEFRQILAFYVRKKALTLRQANMIMQEAENLMRGGQFEVPSAEILSICEGNDCTAYQAEYLALARELDVPVVTMNRSMLRKFSPTAISAQKYIKHTGVRESVLAE